MKQEVVIHSKVITDYPNAGRLYYFCRALDTHDQGWVHLSIDLAAAFFQIKRQTVRLWFKEMMSEGFLRGLRTIGKKKEGVYDVQLRNFRDIEEKAVGWSFASTKVLVGDLSNRTLMLQTSYEIAVLSQQERTERAINHKAPDSRKVFNPSIALTPKGGKRKASNTVNGFPNVGRGLNFFLKSTQQSYGASLKSVCHHLEKARATVHKYTKQMERAFIWQRTSKSEEAHYSFCKRNSKGEMVEVHYKQRPNFYFAKREIKNRKCNPEKQTARKAQADKDLKQQTVDFILSQKTIARRTLEDKLIDLSEKQLRKFAWWLLWCLKKVDAEDHIAKLSHGDLLTQLVLTEKVLSKEEKRFVSWLCKQVKKNKFLRRDLQDFWANLPVVLG